MNKVKSFWRFREKTLLAKAVDILPTNLYPVLARKEKVSWDLACRLDEASLKILGPKRRICASIWMENLRTKHKAFSGRPLKKS